jgi:hypothetical protein
MIQLNDLDAGLCDLTERESSTIQGGGLGFAGGSLASYFSDVYTSYRDNTKFDHGGSLGRAAIWGLGGALAGSSARWVGASLAD